MSSNPAFKIKRMCATTVFYGEEVIQITEIPKASVAAKRDEPRTASVSSVLLRDNLDVILNNEADIAA